MLAFDEWSRWTEKQPFISEVVKWGKERKDKARERERARENNNFFPVSHLTLEASHQPWINTSPSLFFSNCLAHAHVRLLHDENFYIEGNKSYSIHRPVSFGFIQKQVSPLGWLDRCHSVAFLFIWSMKIKEKKSEKTESPPHEHICSSVV